MEKPIDKLVGIYFEDIPYSDKAVQVQENITEKLNSEYEKLIKDKPYGEAFEEIVSMYGTFSNMLELAGYSAKEVKDLSSGEKAKDLKTVKKEMWRQRRRIYGISFFLAAAFAELLWFIYDLLAAPRDAFFVFGYMLLLAAGAFCLYKRFMRYEREHQTEKYQTEAFKYLHSLSDKYAKRRLNTIALTFAVITIFVLSELRFYFLGSSKFAELVENFFANIILIEIPIYLLIKNILMQKMFFWKCKLPKEALYRRNRIGITVFSGIYWLSANIITIISGQLIHYSINLILLLGSLFALLVLIYNITLRKSFTYKNIVINKKRIAVFMSAVIIFSGYSLLQRDTWYTQPYINSIPVVEHNNHQISYNEENGVYTITSSEQNFKILHLTDIHLGGSLYSYSKDLKALKACYALIEYTKPDFVIVTGDLCFPLGIMSMSLNNSTPVHQFAAFMRNIGIPWAFTYGNHDTEGLATLSSKELNDVYKSLSYKTSGNLLYPYVQPDISGRNNQLIELRNSDGSLNNALFLIDSNAYTGEGINVYDYIHDDQVDWYADEVKRLSEQEGHTINSLVFFHIPIQQYRTAYELYEAGSDEVKYFFGKNGEKMIDKVCCSDYPSSLFDRMLELGSTTGVFCGHDHYNNMSLEYKGIRLTYGMSIDYLAMPGIEDDEEQRGGELITLHPDGSWDLEQIPLKTIME